MRSVDPLVKRMNLLTDPAERWSPQASTREREAMTSSVIGGWTRVKAIGLGVVLVVGILIGAAIAATPAGAIVTTLYVAPGTLGVGGSCASPDYNTISAAVSGATSGDTIDVCPGTYNEMVHLKSIPTDAQRIGGQHSGDGQRIGPT